MRAAMTGTVSLQTVIALMFSKIFQHLPAAGEDALLGELDRPDRLGVYPEQPEELLSTGSAPQSGGEGPVHVGLQGSRFSKEEVVGLHLPCEDEHPGRQLSIEETAAYSFLDHE